MKLTSTARPLDKARACRALIAWQVGDPNALDAVLAEVMSDVDPVATPALLFAVLDLACSVITVVPDADQADVLAALRMTVAGYALAAEQEPGAGN